jgi:glycopeptide antibiotics resistance protein
VAWLRDRRVQAALVVAYVVALVVIVTGPWGWALNRLTVALYVQFRYDWPVAPDWAGPEHYGFGLNILLFVPMGALAVLTTRWSWWTVTIAAALASTGIEVVQSLFLTRFGDVKDIVANPLGALVGAVAVSALRRLGWRRAGRPAPPRRR